MRHAWPRGPLYCAAAKGKREARRRATPSATAPHAPRQVLPGAAAAAAGVDAEERWFWDLSGVLALRGVMDDRWLAQANGVLDRCPPPAAVSTGSEGRPVRKRTGS